MKNISIFIGSTVSLILMIATNTIDTVNKINDIRISIIFWLAMLLFTSVSLASFWNVITTRYSKNSNSNSLKVTPRIMGRDSEGKLIFKK